MTNSVLKSIKRKNKLYKNYLTNSCKKNENIYKRYKNKLNHIIKISKKKYFGEQLIKYKHDSKMIWRTLNEILNEKAKTNELPKTFLNTNSNDTPINIGPNLAQNIKNNADTNFEKYFIGNYQNRMFLEPITENELENEIKSKDSSKSPGYDNISNKILKLTAKEISKPLTHIFNLTFHNGVIPEKLKLAI